MQDKEAITGLDDYVEPRSGSYIPIPITQTMIESAWGAKVANAINDLNCIFLRSTAILPLTTADVLVPGMSTIIHPIASETILCIMAVDFNIVTAGVGFCNASVYLNGNNRGSGPAFGLGPTGVGRAGVIGICMGGLATNADNVVELRARKTVNAGVANAEQNGLSNTNSGTTLAIIRFKN